jgi:hypothetical protein
MRFEELPEHCLPCSQAVWGGDAAGASQINDQVIANVVARCRGTAPVSKPAPAPMPDAASRADELVGWSAPTCRG